MRVINLSSVSGENLSVLCVILYLLAFSINDVAFSTTFREVIEVHGSTEGVSAGVGLDYLAADADTIAETTSCIPKGRICPVARGYTTGYTLIRTRNNTWAHAVDLGMTSISALMPRFQMSVGQTFNSERTRTHLLLKFQPYTLSFFAKPAFDFSRKIFYFHLGVGAVFY